MKGHRPVGVCTLPHAVMVVVIEYFTSFPEVFVVDGGTTSGERASSMLLLSNSRAYMSMVSPIACN